MGFKCGIVGLPNVGKSTLFNALTAAGAVAANYPFATIEPNVGVAFVPDPRLDRIAAIVKPKAVIPTAMEFVDIAGLVEGASEGEGLGNQFLAHIRETQAIAHVVRCFEDPDVSHVRGDVDPATDIVTVETELALADLATSERALDRHRRKARSGERESATAAADLERITAHLDQGLPVRTLRPSPSATSHVRELGLLTAKPVMFVANVDDSPEAKRHTEVVRSIAASEHAPVVVISGAHEAEIAELDEVDKAEFLDEIGEEEPGLHRFIRTGHDLLGLGIFFTAGEKEARAWTFRLGLRAPEAAGIIHTDFEKGFIRAEVISYDDFIAHDGEAGAKEAGRWRLEGKDYVVAEGDIVHFRFNL